MFERARPPGAEPALGSLVAIPDDASFPSGHAALSRVYLRVHYPSDVLAVAFLGAGLGALAAMAALMIAPPNPPRPA